MSGCKGKARSLTHRRRQERRFLGRNRPGLLPGGEPMAALDLVGGHWPEGCACSVHQAQAEDGDGGRNAEMYRGHRRETSAKLLLACAPDELCDQVVLRHQSIGCSHGDQAPVVRRTSYLGSRLGKFGPDP